MSSSIYLLIDATQEMTQGIPYVNEVLAQMLDSLRRIDSTGIRLAVSTFSVSYITMQPLTAVGKIKAIECHSSMGVRSLQVALDSLGKAVSKDSEDFPGANRQLYVITNGLPMPPLNERQCNFFKETCNFHKIEVITLKDLSPDNFSLLTEDIYNVKDHILTKGTPSMKALVEEAFKHIGDCIVKTESEPAKPLRPTTQKKPPIGGGNKPLGGGSTPKRDPEEGKFAGTAQDKEIALLKSKLKVLETDNTKLRQELQQKLTNAQTGNASVSAAQTARMKALEAENGSLQAKLRQLQTDLNNSGNQSAAWEREKQGLEEQLRQARSSAETRERERDEALGRLAKAGNADAQLENLRLKLEAAEGKVSSKEGEVTNLKSQNEKLQATVSDLEDKLKVAKPYLDQLALRKARIDELNRRAQKREAIQEQKKLDRLIKSGLLDDDDGEFF